MAKQIILLSDFFNVLGINAVGFVSLFCNLIDVVPDDTQGVHYGGNILKRS